MDPLQGGQYIYQSAFRCKRLRTLTVRMTAQVKKNPRNRIRCCGQTHDPVSVFAQTQHRQGTPSASLNRLPFTQEPCGEMLIDQIRDALAVQIQETRKTRPRYRAPAANGVEYPP